MFYITHRDLSSVFIFYSPQQPGSTFSSESAAVAGMLLTLIITAFPLVEQLKLTESDATRPQTAQTQPFPSSHTEFTVLNLSVRSRYSAPGKLPEQIYVLKWSQAFNLGQGCRDKQRNHVTFHYSSSGRKTEDSGGEGDSVRAAEQHIVLGR